MPSFSTITAVAGGVLAVVYIALQWYLRATQDPREPPAMETALPYIKSAIGLSKNSNFSSLSKRYAKLPIFTLRLPGQKIYVVNDPQLISAVQRQYKYLSFQTVEDTMAHRMFSLGPITKELQQREAEAWRNGPNHVPSPAHVQHKALAPGKGLDELNRYMLKSLEASVEDWIPQGAQYRSTNLFEWVKEVLIIPTTDGVYGPENLFRDPTLRKAYWAWFAGIPTMVKGGGFLVKESVAAIKSMSSTWANSLEGDNLKKHSTFIQNMFEWYNERNFPMEDLAQLITGSAVAILGNTLPTAFWFVIHLYSDPKVLEACREEILAQVVHSKDESGMPVKTLDITALKVACPIFHSAFREVLRFEAIGVGVRAVDGEVMLDGKYLLKKDALVFIPLKSQHYDHDRWGADAEEYCYDRFADKTRPRVSNVSFRTFGGGTTLCPGRHFATTEILSFAAMLLMRFDITPKDGRWVIPTSSNADLTSNLPAPDFDVGVEIRKRPEDAETKWVWRLSESEHTVMLGDQDEHGNDKV